MAHHTSRDAYHQLTRRLNRFPQGAPAGELLFRILEMLFSAREAELVARLPIRPFTVQRAARTWGLPMAETRTVLDTLAGRGILLDVETDGRVTYVLPPPMAGFFEFSLMRVRSDIDQRVLSELFYQYINVEEEFIRQLLVGGETPVGRVFVDETVVDDQTLHVLDYERASEVIRTATHRAVGLCYCRHKMAHLDRACPAPLDICMTFNSVAGSLIRHGIARAVDVPEGLDLLQQAREERLVQFGENVRREVSFICNCCGCCCEAMIGARRFGFLHPVQPANFLPRIESDGCTGCGRCVPVCPVSALGLVSAQSPHDRRRKLARVDAAVCLGCGVCAGSCPQHAIRLEPRPRRPITPLDSTHRIVAMAIERGKLPNLIFDNQMLLSHRAMAAVLGVILKLPPLKQMLAGRQLKSRYLENLIAARRRRNPIIEEEIEGGKRKES